jgi:hypothetical protein
MEVIKWCKRVPVASRSASLLRTVIQIKIWFNAVKREKVLENFSLLTLMVYWYISDGKRRDSMALSRMSIGPVLLALVTVVAHAADPRGVLVDGYDSLIELIDGAARYSYISYRGCDTSFAVLPDGKQAVTWKTGKVPANEASRVTFVLGVNLAAGEQEKSAHQLFINGKPIVKIELPVTGDITWRDGEVAAFFDLQGQVRWDSCVEGVLYITVPVTAVAPGEQATFKLQSILQTTQAEKLGKFPGVFFVTAARNTANDPETRPQWNPEKLVPIVPLTGKGDLQYDGAGVFQFFDRPSKNQGLITLLSRGRVRDEQNLVVSKQADGELRASDRVVFFDEYTGAEIWRMTNYTHGVVRHPYTNWPVWSCDGRQIMLESPRCLIDQATFEMFAPKVSFSGNWHPSEPTTFLGRGTWEGKPAIVAFDSKTLKPTRAIGPVRGYTGHYGISSDGKWMTWREGTQDTATTIGIAATDGSVYRCVSVEGQVLTERSPINFDPLPNPPPMDNAVGGAHSISIGRGDPKPSMQTASREDGTRISHRFDVTGKLQHRTYSRTDGRSWRKYFDNEGHVLREENLYQPDLAHASTSPDGAITIGFTRGSGVMAFDEPNNRQWSIFKAVGMYEGHSSWTTRNPRWVIVSARNSQASEILRISVKEDRSVIRLCGSGCPNPEMGSYDNLEFACSSPDGTKVIFMSSMTGSINEYIVVSSNPCAPTLTAERTAGGFKLKIVPHMYSQEIKRYRIYKTSRSGEGYSEIAHVACEIPGAKLSHVLQEPIDGKPVYFTVRAEEWSGLLSANSNEVATEGAQVTRYIEAENMSATGFMTGFDPKNTGDLHYLLSPKTGIPCTVSFDNDLADSVIWVRVAGEHSGFSLTNNIKVQQVHAAAYSDWTWVKLEGLLGKLSLNTASPNFKIDRVFISVDHQKIPQGIGLDHPTTTEITGITSKKPSAVALSPHSVELKWRLLTGARHYNVYASEKADFDASQATLILSPPPHVETPTDAIRALDWGLKPGQKYYYKISAVDDFGFASTPSDAAMVETPPLAVAKVETEYESGILEKSSIKDEPEASNGKAVLVDKEQSVEVKISVPLEGYYIIWHCWRADSGTDIRSKVAIDTTNFGHSDKYDLCMLRGLVVSREYEWSRYRLSGQSNKQGVIFLKAGEHSIRFSSPTAKIYLDKLIITNDHSFVPSGRICTF